MKKSFVAMSLALILCFAVSSACASVTVTINTSSNGEWSGSPAKYIKRASGVVGRWGIICHGIVDGNGSRNDGSTRAYLYSREDANRCTTIEKLDVSDSEPTRCYEYVKTPVSGRGYKVVAMTNDASVFQGGYSINYHHLP